MNFHGFYISRSSELEPASQKSDLLVNRIEVIEEPDTADSDNLDDDNDEEEEELCFLWILMFRTDQFYFQQYLIISNF